MWKSLWIAGCLLASAFFAGQSVDRQERPAVVTSESEQVRPFKPIEAIRVGDRVITSAESSNQLAATEVNENTWRRLVLEAQDHEDGQLNLIHVETLQPPSWVEEHNAVPGALVPLPLDLLDMGLSDDLVARVVENTNCPKIAEGRGRVVLTTTNSLSSDVWEMIAVDQQGEAQTIRPTGLHKFYSLTNQRWVSAKELENGERLDGISGELRVSKIERLQGIQRVYNMTVEEDHVYRVSLSGILVHNNDCRKTYQTYTKTNETTGTVYSGRASGYGTPEQNIARRDSTHHMTEQGYGPAKLDKSSPIASAIRGREQQLIEHHGGAQATGGTSGNYLNGISERNKKGATYRKDAENEFGQPD